MNNRKLIFFYRKGNKVWKRIIYWMILNTNSINFHDFSCSSAGSVVAAVVGGIVGMIFFITCIALLVCTLNQKKKKKKKQNQSQRNQVLSFGADSSNAFHIHGSKFSTNVNIQTIKYFVWSYVQVWMSLTLQKKNTSLPLLLKWSTKDSIKLFMFTSFF